MHAVRRLALCTAANVDGSAAAKQPEPFRDYTRAALSGVSEDDREGWTLDPRIGPQYQLPDIFYNKDRKAFDKGHLARREDMAFGATYDALRYSNNDTYHCTNCSPQVMGFNRYGLWRMLEEAVLTQGKAERYCIFSGAAFRDDDPEFEGHDNDGPIKVRIPVRYWKLLVCVEDGALAAHGFVLRQDLSKVAFSAAEFQGTKLLAEQMVPLADLQARLAPLVLPDAVLAADRYASEGARKVRSLSGVAEGMDWSIWN
jgi:endonuclease G, mitochondrial